MAILSIHTIGRDELKAPNEVVENIEEVKELIADLKETLLASLEGGLGLAAPQVGVNKRVLVMREALNSKVTPVKDKALFAMINPVILKAYPKQGVYREACLSVPGKVCEIARCLSIKVRYMDEEGRNNTIHLEGTDAVVAQHEIDHLNQTLIVDKAIRIITTEKPKEEIPETQEEVILPEIEEETIEAPAEA